MPLGQSALSRSAQAEIAQYEQDDYDKTHNPDDLVHFVQAFPNFDQWSLIEATVTFFPVCTTTWISQCWY
jgi:hypothetical protein